MTDPAPASPAAEPLQIDPALVLTKVQQTGELGAALVRAASWEVAAEHYAAQVAELRKQLDAPTGTEPAVHEGAS